MPHILHLLSIYTLISFFASNLQASELQNALGTIFCDGAVRGTASHIESPSGYQSNHSVVVTAAHVIYNQQTDQPFSACFYRPQNKRLSAIGFKAVSTHRYSTKNIDKIAQAEGDIVFIQLKQKAYQPTLNLSENFLSNSKQLTLLHLDPNQPIDFTYSHCQQINHSYLKSYKLVLHNCPAQKGSSGSPIIERDSGRIFAIHGGRFNIKINSDNKQSKNWVGQARRIDAATLETLKNITKNKP